MYQTKDYSTLSRREFLKSGTATSAVIGISAAAGTTIGILGVGCSSEGPRIIRVPEYFLLSQPRDLRDSEYYFHKFLKDAMIISPEAKEVWTKSVREFSKMYSNILNEMLPTKFLEEYSQDPLAALALPTPTKDKGAIRVWINSVSNFIDKYLSGFFFTSVDDFLEIYGTNPLDVAALSIPPGTTVNVRKEGKKDKERTIEIVDITQYVRRNDAKFYVITNIFPKEQVMLKDKNLDLTVYNNQQEGFILKVFYIGRIESYEEHTQQESGSQNSESPEKTNDNEDKTQSLEKMIRRIICV